MMLPALLLAVLLGQAADVVTADEAKAFAAKIEKSFADKDGTELASALDPAAMADRVLKGLFPDDEGRKMARQACSAFAREFPSTLLAQGTGTGASLYRFLRLKESPEGPRPLFRFVSESGVNYHELVLARDGKRLRVADLYIHTSAELMSETLRKMLLPMLVAKGAKDDAKLKEALDAAAAFGRLAEAVKEQRWQDALDVFDANAARLKGAKMAQLMRLRAAGALDEETYLKVLDEVAKAFPREPFVELLSIDAHLLRKEFPKSLAAIERLDAVIGGDPYLLMLRGNIHQLAGEAEKAREWSTKAVKEEPGHAAAWWAHVEICLGLKDHKEVARGLAHLEKELKVELNDDLSEVELFAEFARSPEGVAWQKGRGR